MNICFGCMERFDEPHTVCPKCGAAVGTGSEPCLLRPGFVLKDRYISGRLLARNATTLEYIGFDRKTEKKVEIRELFPRNAIREGEAKVKPLDEKGFEDLKKAFLEQGQKNKTLRSSGVAETIDSFAENGTIYTVVERLEGLTLTERLGDAKNGTVSFGIAVSEMVKVLHILEGAHEQGFIHGSLTPDKIYEQDAKIRISAPQAADPRDLALVKSGYAGEEICEGKAIGAWTDVYAVGAIFYRSICGSAPDAPAGRLLEDNLKSPAQAGVTIPKNADNAIMNAINRREKRTKTASEFIRQLENESTKRVGVLISLSLSLKLKLATSCAVLLLACLAAFLLLRPQNVSSSFEVPSYAATQGVEVVPNIRNKTIREAQDEISKTSLVLSSQDYGNQLEVYRVTTQNPKAGSVVPPGTEVSIEAKIGSNMSMVPGLVGKTTEEATLDLENLGLVARTFEVYSEHPKNTVSSQNNQDVWIRKGEEIYLYISKGPEFADMPSLIGMTLEEATAILETLDLFAESTGSESYAPAYEDGVVVRHEPAEGQ
ncbi:MAG: PASTA domain-containing protein, partial [Clostridiales bacterium]|nr:PASTA domain-containing protein [Clostridiales bacterium]